MLYMPTKRTLYSMVTYAYIRKRKVDVRSLIFLGRAFKGFSAIDLTSDRSLSMAIGYRLKQFIYNNISVLYIFACRFAFADVTNLSDGDYLVYTVRLIGSGGIKERPSACKPGLT